jgi:putative chitinase
MLDTTKLGAFAPKSVRFVDGLNACVAKAGLITVDRLTMFLAQVAHESGGFLYTKELWGPTPQQLRYERDFKAPWPNSPDEAKLPAFATNRLAFTLGNTEPGDGSKFRGRGLIQTTGRANYAALSKRMFGDSRLLTRPELLEEPQNAAESAGDFWLSRKLNAFCDIGDFEMLTRRINGGLTGLAERKAWLAKAQKLWH